MVLKTKRIHKETNRNTKKRGGGICFADPQRYHFSEFVHCKFEKSTGSKDLTAYVKRPDIKALPMFQSVINGKKGHLKILDYGVFIPNFFVNIDNYFDKNINTSGLKGKEKFVRLVNHKVFRKIKTQEITRYVCQNPNLERLISFVESPNIYEKVIKTKIEIKDKGKIYEYEENLKEIIKYLYAYESKGLFDDFYIKKVYGAVNSLGQTNKQVVNFFTGTNEERKNWQFFIFNFIKSLEPNQIKIYENTTNNRKNITKNEIAINDAQLSIGATSYLLDETNKRHLITMNNEKYNGYKAKRDWSDRNVDIFYKDIQSKLLDEYSDYVECEKECFEFVIDKIKIVINEFDRYLIANENIRNMCIELYTKYDTLNENLKNYIVQFNDLYINDKSVGRYENNSLGTFDFESIKEEIEGIIDSFVKKYNINIKDDVIEKLNEISELWKYVSDKIDDLNADNLDIEVKQDLLSDIQKGFIPLQDKINAEWENYKTKMNSFLKKKIIVLDNKEPNMIRQILSNTYINFQKIHAYLTLVYHFLINNNTETNGKINDSYQEAQKAYISNRKWKIEADYYRNFDIYKRFFNSYINYELFKKIFKCHNYNLFPLHNDIDIFLKKIEDNKLLSRIINSPINTEILEKRKVISTITEYYKNNYASSALLDLTTIDNILTCNKINNVLTSSNIDEQKTFKEKVINDIKTQIMNGFYRLYQENKTDILKKFDIGNDTVDKKIKMYIELIPKPETYLTTQLFQTKVLPIRENILKYKSYAKVSHYIFKSVSNNENLIKIFLKFFLKEEEIKEIEEKSNYNTYYKTIIESFKKMFEYLTWIDNVYTGKATNGEVSNIMNNAEESKKWFDIFDRWSKTDKLRYILFNLVDYKILIENAKYDNWSYYELDSYKNLLERFIKKQNNEETKEGEEKGEEGEEEVIKSKEPDTKMSIEDKLKILQEQFVIIKDIIDKKYEKDKSGKILSIDQKEQKIRDEYKLIKSSTITNLIHDIIKKLDEDLFGEKSDYKPTFIVDVNIDFEKDVIMKNPDEIKQQSLLDKSKQRSSSQATPEPITQTGNEGAESGDKSPKQQPNPLFDFFNFGNTAPAPGNPVLVNSGGKRSSRRKNRNNRKTR